MRRGAIVGLGNVALNGHLPAWLASKDFKIAAGIDSDAARREAFKKLVPDAAVFSNLESCDVPLDFADICTPPHLHFPLVRAALANNLNVLCEKPLVLTQPHMNELESAVSASGKVLMTVHNWRYAPICRKIEEIAGSGVLGALKSCSWYVLRSGPAITTDKNNWRLDPAKAGGGILIDHGWHALYLVLGWMNQKVKNVQASLENRQYEDLGVEDTAKIKIEFEGSGFGAKSPAGAASPAGAVSPAAAASLAGAEIFLTWASRLRRNSGELSGENGILRIEDDHLILDVQGRAPETIKFESALSAGSHHPDWFGRVIEEFSDELNDAQKRGANFKMAKACLEIIEQCKRSNLTPGGVQ